MAQEAICITQNIETAVSMFFKPTEKEVALIKQLLKAHIHPAPFLRNNGVAFEMKDEPSHERLLKMSTADMARYADFVVQAMARDEAFESLVLPNGIPKPSQKLNTTALGGLAYLALHGTKSKQAECVKFLEAYRKSHLKENK